MIESDVRDILVDNLDLLEEGLVLQKKEQYIPNYLGTRGFIDIYAKDKNGNHVLIELKKTKSATREALNEVLKYVEGVKIHFGSREDEIRVIIASAEWSELLVPYSRFVNDITVSVKAIQLNIDEESKIITCSNVDALKYNHGRFIAPWYEVFWYENEESLKKGIESINEICVQKNIRDFIIAIFDLHESIPSIPRAKRMAILSAALGKPTKQIVHSLCSYVLFFSYQIKTEEQYIEILTADEEFERESLCILDGMDEKERLCALHEMVSGLEPYPHSDDVEIGNPAKFSKYFDDENFNIPRIIKRGAFERNNLLTPEILIAELRGFNGSTGQTLRKTIETYNSSQMSSIKKNIDKSLTNNDIWRDRILRNIEEIESDFPASTFDFNLYNPSAGIFTLYFSLTKDEGLHYLPNYTIEIETEDKRRLYFGILSAFNKPKEFKEIIDKYYSGNIGELIHTITWGAWDDRDIDILEDLGLTYCNYRLDQNSEKESFFVMRDGRWRECDRFDPSDKFVEFVNSNKDLIDAIIGHISASDKGDYFASANEELHIVISRKEVESNDTYLALAKLKTLIFTDETALKMQGGLEILFSGYDKDPRELHEIEEVCVYVKKLARQFPYLFYFLNLDSGNDIVTVFADCHINDKNAKEIYPRFLIEQFDGLNKIAKKLGISDQEISLITKKIRTCLKLK